MRFITFFGFFIFSSLISCAQTPKIYLFRDRYEKDMTRIMDENPNRFEEIRIIGGYMIDPKRTGEVDLKQVDVHLARLFPSKDDSGVLCIDLENEIYQDIRNYSAGTLQFEAAMSKFISLIKFIKKSRPNIELGIYGIPFTVYYDSQMKRNIDRKLDPLLELTDFISPSLYVFYPALQRGEDANLEYFNKNLRISFEYADRLGKKVKPFVWYLIHPSNRQYQFELLDKDEMRSYYDYIISYRSDKGSKVEGIIWWETPTPFSTKKVRRNLLLDNNQVYKSGEVIAIDYFKYFGIIE